jgi:transcriptional regulator GlxA family with amidase domain
MQIACFIYDGITALDIIGPYEVLQRLPDADLRFVAKQAGEVRTDNDLIGLVAANALRDVTAPDIVVVPGGWGSRALETDDEVLDWIRAAHATSTWTTSVCTGSLILGAAGVLDGLEATTHWAQLDRLKEFGAIPTGRRVVPQGKVVTAAGVSSGIDMALWLAGQVAGDDWAQGIQLGIEYDPQPPYDAGSPDKAPAAVVGMLRELFASRSVR